MLCVESTASIAVLNVEDFCITCPRCLMLSTQKMRTEQLVAREFKPKNSHTLLSDLTTTLNSPSWHSTTLLM